MCDFNFSPFVLTEPVAPSGGRAVCEPDAPACAEELRGFARWLRDGGAKYSNDAGKGTGPKVCIRFE